MVKFHIKNRLKILNGGFGCDFGDKNSIIYILSFTFCLWGGGRMTKIFLNCLKSPKIRKEKWIKENKFVLIIYTSFW